MNRPGLDATMLAAAAVFAERATCTRLQVGAVLARDGRVLSTGYNGAPSGEGHCDCGTSPCWLSVHAEANALLFAARHGVAALGATLYVTHAPCMNCAGWAINAGVAEVVYGQPYRSVEGLDRLRAAGVMVRCP